MSVLHPRSHCPRCGAGIFARDNVPILGWLVLRGRCRGCRGAIPPRYALVELAVGLLFALPYVCTAALAGGDPWERIGPGRLLGILLASWMVTVLGAFAILVGRELLPSFGLDWRGGSVGRQRDAKARHPSPLVHEEVAVELDDLVGASGIPSRSRAMLRTVSLRRTTWTIVRGRRDGRVPTRGDADSSQFRRVERGPAAWTREPPTRDREDSVPSAGSARVAPAATRDGVWTTQPPIASSSSRGGITSWSPGRKPPPVIRSLLRCRSDSAYRSEP